MRVRDPIRFAYLQIIGDLVLASVLIHATGGGQSAFFFLYFLDVVAVALLAQRRGAAIVAGASAVLMVGVSVAGYCAHPAAGPGPELAARGSISARRSGDAAGAERAGAGRGRRRWRPTWRARPARPASA